MWTFLNLLVDPPLVVYVVLGLLTAFTGAMWFLTRRRGAMIRFLIVADLLVMWLAVDVMIESAREQAVRKTKAMVAAIPSKNVDRLFAMISESFGNGTVTKASLRTATEHYIVTGELTEVVVWDFDRSRVHETDTTIEIAFFAKPRGPYIPPGLFYACRARFLRDPDGEYRLSDLKLLKPSTEEPISVPGIE